MIIVPAALAMPPQPLGHGRIGQAVNLETGAWTSSKAPFFDDSGFASPTLPQPMQLSSAQMVYQSERLLSESQEVFRQVQSLRNQTQDAAINARAMEQGSREYANLSWQSAMMARNESERARSELEEARSIYNGTKTSARRIENWARWLIYAPKLQASGSQCDGCCQTELERLGSQLEDVSHQVEQLNETVTRMQMA